MVAIIVIIKLNNMEFQEFPKMPRFSRECVITEKIDGTNAQIFIQNSELEEELHYSVIIDKVEYNGILYTIRAGSRNKWVIPGKQDNAGFASWVLANAKELVKLGEGRHFGEWWGKGIQRGYNMQEKVFSLFNTERWESDDIRPKCCRVVPKLWEGNFDNISEGIMQSMNYLTIEGSAAAPGFMNPEGIVIFHKAGNFGFKKTILKDEVPKSLVK
jgi:hypothetical protein